MYDPSNDYIFFFGAAASFQDKNTNKYFTDRVNEQLIKFKINSGADITVKYLLNFGLFKNSY